MKRMRRDMFGELEALKGRLKVLLDENMAERRRTVALLRDSERKVEDQFGQIGSFQSVREEAARRFRKGPGVTNGTGETMRASQSGSGSVACPPGKTAKAVKILSVPPNTQLKQGVNGMR